MRSKVFFIFIILVISLSGQKVNSDLIYLVNQPTQKTAKVPVLIMLHGYGSNEEDLFEISKALDPRLITFSLRGPIAKGQGTYCWYELSRDSEGNFVYDYKQAQASKTKILSFISQACKVYKLDSTQVFLIGFSQGAIMSYEIAASAPTKVKGILALSGRLMEETKQLKTDWTKVAELKYFIAHGYSDNMIKISEAEKAVSFFKEKKAVDVTYKAYEMPHTISGAELNDIKEWLVKALKPKSAAPTSK
ncbi:MAG: hypothetical protein JNL60_12845 [Bacteroidia bacterium]|nr:hypothetical protein [Bacteroidia bacterium]